MQFQLANLVKTDGQHRHVKENLHCDYIGNNCNC